MVHNDTQLTTYDMKVEKHIIYYLYYNNIQKKATFPPHPKKTLG